MRSVKQNDLAVGALHLLQPPVPLHAFEAGADGGVGHGEEFAQGPDHRQQPGGVGALVRAGQADLIIAQFGVRRRREGQRRLAFAGGLGNDLPARRGRRWW